MTRSYIKGLGDVQRGQGVNAKKYLTVHKKKAFLEALPKEVKPAKQEVLRYARSRGSSTLVDALRAAYVFFTELSYRFVI